MSETLWIIISWIGQVLLLLIMGIVLFIIVGGLLLGLWKAVAKALPKRQHKYVPQDDWEKYELRYLQLGSARWGGGTAQRQGFTDGANWAWQYFHGMDDS